MSCGADVSAAFLAFVVDGKIGGETPAPRKTWVFAEAMGCAVAEASDAETRD
jgi:hypothetical protein